MTIVDVLKTENERTLLILDELEDATAARPARREQLLRDLSAQLAGKHRAEERVLYPLVATEPGSERVVAELRRESRALESLVKGLQQLPKNDPNFQLQLDGMAARIRAHLAREDSDLMPLARGIAEAEEWGERLHRGAREAQAQARG